jgi:cbb3-type cytochrome oxidase subunit 3
MRLVFAIYLGCCTAGLAQTDSASIHKLNQKAYSLYLSASDSAVVLAQQALQLATALHLESEKGRSYLALSKAYWAKSNFFLSTRYAFDAVYAFENSPFPTERSLAYLALARTLVELKNKTRAHEFLKKATHDALSLRDTLLIAECYREYSFLFAERQQYDSALWYADRGIELFSLYKQPIDISILYGRKSRIYFELGDYEKSKAFAYKGILTDSLSGNIRAFAASKFFIAQSDFKLGNNGVAMKKVREATQLFESIHNYQWLIRCHQLLADLYKAEGNQTKLIQELELISASKDSLYNAEKSGQAEEMQALYDFSAKETTIQLLEKENQLQQQHVKNQRLFAWVLVVGILLLLAVVFFLFRLQKLQQQATQRVMKQKEEIEAQALDLEKLNQLKNKLFSVIGHDLRGPINNLKIILDLISSNKISPQDFINITDKLRSNLDTTQRTLENLLSWSMTQMEGIKVDPQRIGLGYSVDEACFAATRSSSGQKYLHGKKYPRRSVCVGRP